jgi:hypothetical protein
VATQVCAVLTNINIDGLSVGIFYRRIIAFYPDVLNKLCCARSAIICSNFTGLTTYLSDNFSRLHLQRHLRQPSLAADRVRSNSPDPRTTMWYSRCDMLQTCMVCRERGLQQSRRRRLLAFRGGVCHRRSSGSKWAVA